MNELVKTEVVDDHIAKVILNRPEKMNAINVGMRKQLREKLEAFAIDDDVRVVIITGAESEGIRKSFSSGDDLNDPGFKMDSPTVLLDYYKAS
jgi:enoyl-CoA hydratase/carnithine racemase